MIYFTEEERKIIDEKLKKADEQYAKGECYTLEEAIKITTKKLEKFFSKHPIK